MAAVSTARPPRPPTTEKHKPLGKRTLLRAKVATLTLTSKPRHPVNTLSQKTEEKDKIPCQRGCAIPAWGPVGKGHGLLGAWTAQQVAPQPWTQTWVSLGQRASTQQKSLCPQWGAGDAHKMVSRNSSLKLCSKLLPVFKQFKATKSSGDKEHWTWSASKPLLSMRSVPFLLLTHLSQTVLWDTHFPLYWFPCFPPRWQGGMVERRGRCRLRGIRA